MMVLEELLDTAMKRAARPPRKGGRQFLIVLSQLILAIGLFVGLKLFCDMQTQGFRLRHIVSTLPTDPRWEVPPLTPEQQQEINTLLSQPYTLLRKEGVFYSFLGADGKTVLKFFRHRGISIPDLLKDFSWLGLLYQATSLENPLASCALLFRQAPAESGLLYVHLNRTQDLLPRAILKDKLGISHSIDLNTTEFVIQKHADPLLTKIDRLIQSQDIASAQHTIHATLSCLVALSQKGLKQQSNKKPLAITSDGSLSLDLSSYIEDSSLKDPVNSKKELLEKTHTLSLWLQKKAPDLHSYYLSQIDTLLSPE